MPLSDYKFMGINETKLPKSFTCIIDIDIKWLHTHRSWKLMKIYVAEKYNSKHEK